MNFLDFRDSFMPYLGLIIFLSLNAMWILIGFFSHARKSIYWSAGNLVGLFVGWLVLFLAGGGIVNLIVDKIDLDAFDLKDFGDVFLGIVSIVWFFVFTLLWNLIILLPNYYIWYKRVAKIKNSVITDKTMKGRLTGTLISVVCFLPMSTIAGAVGSDLTTSQHCLNAKNAGKFDETLSTVGGSISYVKDSRQLIDAAAAVLKVYEKIQVWGEKINNVISTPKMDDPTEVEDWIDGAGGEDANFIQDGETNDWYLSCNDYVGGEDQETSGRTLSSWMSQAFLPKKITNTAGTFLGKTFIPDDASVFEWRKIDTYEIYTDQSSDPLPLFSLEGEGDGAFRQISSHDEGLQLNFAPGPSYNLHAFKPAGDVEGITDSVWLQGSSAKRIATDLSKYLFSDYSDLDADEKAGCAEATQYDLLPLFFNFAGLSAKDIYKWF